MSIEPETWKRASDIFERAIDLDATERREWIKKQCRGDADVESAVLKLLDADENAESDEFLERSIPTADPGLLDDILKEGDETIRDGGQFGPYRLLRLIGQGGMGEVHLAERADGVFEQQVALKLLPRPTPGLMQRFSQERRILARLEHPNIARLVDGGIGEHGIPYFAMEYVEGLPINLFVSTQRLDVAATLKLFQAVCDAVQYAHRSLVVHRDLKPSNILVANDGTPKLLDFGIAKLLATTDVSSQATATRVFTPDYAAPEQIAGAPVTTATDVYSLGVVLYELLAGAKPYTFKSGSPNDRTDPTPPSTRCAIADPRRGRVLRGDVDRIVLTMLQHEPQRRYGSAEAIGNDIRRYLEGRPIAARGDSAAYRVRKFLRRNRLAIAAAAVVLVALVAATAVSLWQAGIARNQSIVAERAAALAVRREHTAETVEKFMVGLFQAPDPAVSLGKMPRADELLERGAARATEELAGQPAVQAELFTAMANSYFELDVLEKSAQLLEKARDNLADPDVDDALRLRVYMLLARSYAELSRHDDALAALELAERLPAVDASNSLRLANIKGWILRDMGRLDASESAMRAAMGDMGSPLDESRASLLNNLAYTLQLEDKTDESIATYERVIAYHEQREAPNDPKLLWAKVTFAKSLRELGKPERACALLGQTRPLLLSVVGPEHHDLNSLDIALGQCKMDLGEAVDGRALIADALRRTEKASTAHNDNWVTNEIALAEADFRLERNAEARSEFIAARKAATELTYSSTPDTRNCDAYLAALDARGGKTADARDRLNAIADEQRAHHEFGLRRTLTLIDQLPR